MDQQINPGNNTSPVTPFGSQIPIPPFPQASSSQGSSVAVPPPSLNNDSAMNGLNPQTAQNNPILPKTSDDTSVSGQANTSQTSAPIIAEDSDLIEKEWVSKAKQIVAKNSEDPYVQSRELTIFKAEYMKKRYNRTIKLGE